jgi:RNA polymerase sigma factor (sigma-70 family)
MLHHHNTHYVGTIDVERSRDLARRHRPVPDEVAEMVSRATFGDQEAWSWIRRRYGARVRSAARQYSLSGADADDVAQNTWLRLFQHLGSIRDPRALGAWLETTARRESLRLLGSHQRELVMDHVELPDVPAPPEPDPHQDQDRLAALGTAFDRLPARHAALMRMLIADPTPSYAEISEALDMPIGSIGPIRARVLDRLRDDTELVRALVA